MHSRHLQNLGDKFINDTTYYKAALFRKDNKDMRTNKISIKHHATLRVYKSDKNPITGGPKINPLYPIVVTALIPTPAFTPGIFPARL